MVELLLVMTIAAVMLAVAVPRGALILDRISVDAAAGDIHATLAMARSIALAGGVAVAVDVDSLNGVLRVRRGDEILLSRGVGGAHGVRVGRTRDSLTYDPRGLGRGAANMSIMVRRGAAAETVFVSRLGRVR